MAPLALRTGSSSVVVYYQANFRTDLLNAERETQFAETFATARLPIIFSMSDPYATDVFDTAAARHLCQSICRAHEEGAPSGVAPYSGSGTTA